MTLIYKSPLPSYGSYPRGNAVNVAFSSPHIKAHPDKVVISSCDGPERLTARQCNDLASRLAVWLQEKGVKRNDVVCLFIENSIWTRSLHHAILTLGAVISPANAQYGADELAHQLRLSKASLIISADERMDVTHAAIEQVPQSVNISLFSELDKSARRLLSGGKRLEPILLDSSSHAYYCFSSGTSGLPKCVITTHANIIANMLQFSGADGPLCDPNAVVGACLPMSHIFGLLVYVWGGTWANNKLVVFPRWNLDKVVNAIEQQKITAMAVVPPMILAFAHLTPEYRTKVRGSLRHCMSGAAPLSKSTAQLLQKSIPEIRVAQGYGMTESTPITLCSLGRTNGSKFYRDYDASSAGWLVPDTEARLIDPETNQDAVPKDGQRPKGELWLRGPQVMAGYLDNVAATSEALTPTGWLRTGDVAVIEPDGQFYIVDRIKELIKSRGHQVAPAELEALLLRQDGVLDAAVIGVPSPESGDELPRAYVVLKPGVSPKDVENSFNSKFPPYKRLRGGLVVVDAVPKSPSGKILRRLLRDRVRSESQATAKPKL